MFVGVLKKSSTEAMALQERNKVRLDRKNHCLVAFVGGAGGACGAVFFNL